MCITMEVALLIILVVLLVYVSLIFVLPRLISIICTFFLQCTLVARRINLQGRALEDITLSKPLANGLHVEINLKRVRFGSNWMSNAHAYLDIAAEEVEVKVHGCGSLSSWLATAPKGAKSGLEDHGSSGRISFGRWFDRAVSLSNLISCSITNLSLAIELEDPKKGRLWAKTRVSHFLMSTKRIHHENEKLCCQIGQIHQELAVDECTLGWAEIPSLEILIDFDLIALDLAQAEIRVPSHWHGLKEWHPALKLPALLKQEFVLNVDKLKVKWPQKNEFNLQCHSLRCGSTRFLDFALLLLEVNVERAHGEFNATTTQLSVNLPAILSVLVELPEPLKNQSMALTFHYLRLDTKDIGSDFSVHAMVFSDVQGDEQRGQQPPILKVESISSSCDGDRTLINVHAHKLEVHLEYSVMSDLLSLTALTLAKIPRRPISVTSVKDRSRLSPVERHISVGCDQISAVVTVDPRGNVSLSTLGQDFGVSFKGKSSWAATIRKISLIDHTRLKRPLVFLDCEQPLSLIREAQALQVTTKSNIRVSWQGYAHLALFRMSSLVKDKLQGLPSFWKANPGPSSQGASVKFSADCPSISIHLHLPETLMTLVFKNPTLTRTIENAFHLGVAKGRIGFDKHPDIIGWSDLNICSAENQSNHRAEMTKKITPVNRLIEISVVNFEISFPYEYNVHKAYSTDLLGTFKWLKRVHGVDQSNFDRIHPDVLLYAKTISFQLADDPFEVSLRDNYELLEDEFFESHKRAVCLEAKIDDLRRTHILLPSNKIEELFANLLKKNAEIYIQRSKNLRQKTPRRTRLMQACYNSLKLHILSDQSLAGWENMTKFMKGVESDLVWPEDISFSTILAKWVRFECKNAFLKLRDFPQPFIEMRHLLFWGKVVFADESPGPRAKRTQALKMGHPFPDETIERSLQSPKLYMDIAMDMGYYSFSHGPCWEPVIGQVFAAMNYITGLTKNDPSPPLTWWDKMRYFIHGRLLWSVQSYKGYLHTSLDPYNTTEEIELSLTNANFQFINNAVVKCDAQSLDLFARTASKYDDCRLFHTPNFSLSIYFVWLCQGQAKDHFAVSLCSRQKLPEFSAQQGHDSFRAFRSHNMNVRINLETTKTSSHEKPKIHLYSSTIRWMESLKWLFSGMARPVRRGALFGTPPVRKQSFFRHFKDVDISCSFNCLEFDYWTSASMTKGILVVISKGLFFSGKYRLHLAKVNDGLIRRPRTAWITEYTNCEFSSTDVWFQCIWSNNTSTSATSNMNNSNNNNNNNNADTDTASEGGQSSSTVSEEGGSRQLEKNFFFFVEKVQYNRDISKFKQQQQPPPQPSQTQPPDASATSCPLHCLIVNGARGAWTTSNRDMAFALYQSWRRAHILRNQLSSDGLKPLQQKDIEMSAPNTGEATTPGSQESSPPLGLFPKRGDDELCLSKLSWNDKAYVEELLENPSCTTVYSDDQYVNAKEKELDAKTAACGKNDVQQREWVIKFINCQMLLKGTETKGYLILSATKAEALRTIHTPVWKDETLLSKISWSGALECMQYFATVSPNPETVLIDEILWVPQEMIESRETTSATLAPQEDLIDASNRSVGGVISGQSGPHQLQRIVSQCKCEFFYVAYGDDSVEVDRDLIPKRPEESPWTDRDDYVNCFALIHHDLNVSTNSLQYSMILDVVNNLLLFIDPTFRSRTENFLRLKYQLMLSNVMDQRKPIAQLQSQIRQLICQLRAREKDVYYFHSGRNHERALEDLETEIQRLKESVAHMSEELDLRLRCLNDFQLSQNQKRHLLHNDRKGELRQKSEIFFSRAQWRLTETDGQLGIADADIVNFSYSRAIMRDDSTEHLLEIGYITVKNLLKEQLYTEVISPSDLTNVPVDRQRTLRMFCREKPPVGGISVKDHFEINLVPLSIGITQSFYKKIVMLCFPERLSADAKVDQIAPKDKKKAVEASKSSAKKSSNFYVDVPLCKDDVELMKERAQQNKLFVYIKIPEVPINVSFKSEKEKNKILDVSGFLLQVPTIEYHNVTWTWLDFLMAVKSRTKDSLVSQAIKQKLSMRSTHAKSEAKNKRQNALNLQDDTEKAKLLFGDINFPQGGTRKKK
ncbi:protein hobbit-like [Tigriopus californicus]|uniref:protein hobbit-like n=1 Tax=Tigriopus californicus TaxID=6832 RepID=UPI0027D9F010|nr:protein hobbit-like [Tigriopus californicus]